jgi:hypothetical protein
MFCAAPMDRPTAAAMPIEVKLANSAAASAGTTCSGSARGSTEVTGATSTPSAPTMAAASSVFSIARPLGDSPERIADTSFSDAALVASPKCDQRYNADSATAAATTMPASRRWLTGTRTSKTCTTPWGRISGALLGSGPNAMRIADCVMSRIPSDATSFASGDAVRNGRKASSSISTPHTSDTRMVSTKATGVVNVGPNSPVLKPQKA